MDIPLYSTPSLKLSTKILGINLPTPIIISSGVLGNDYESIGIRVLPYIGAIITKTVSVNSISGNTEPTIHSMGNGNFINWVGLKNPGVEEFCKESLPNALSLGVPIIVSVLPHYHHEETGRLIRIISDKFGNRISGFELNLSCPNINSTLSKNSIPCAISTCLNNTNLPIFCKFGVYDIENLRSNMKFILDCKDKVGLSLINSIPSAYIPPESDNIRYGGLSGPSIKPIALNVVASMYKESSGELCILGCGGISTHQDALDYIKCGASAVQVGSAVLRNKSCVKNIAKSLSKRIDTNIYNLIGEGITNASKNNI